jgi:hypothetical protein
MRLARVSDRQPCDRTIPEDRKEKDRHDAWKARADLSFAHDLCAVVVSSYVARVIEETGIARGPVVKMHSVNVFVSQGPSINKHPTANRITPSGSAVIVSANAKK